MNRAELDALLRLHALPAMGPVRLRRLWERYGSFEAALGAPGDDLGEGAAQLGTARLRARAARAAEVVERLGVEVLLEAAPGYPKRLRHLAKPPFVLYARGRTDLAAGVCVAVIGTRRNTTYGGDVAWDLAYGLAQAGLTVVSGLARGIDGIAHRAALDAGGGTVAVQGCGCDVAYPREHEALQRRIAEEGLLLSEFPPGEPPRRDHFPRRNRILAALATGVVVVEAGEKSGSLITVAHALELGREVFAVPGPITRQTSAGTNAMLRDGAGIVTGVADVLDGLAEVGVLAHRAGASRADSAAPAACPPDEKAPPGLARDRIRLWHALDREPRHAEELAGACGLDAAGVLAALLELELAGLARQLPGKQFIRA